MFKTSTTHPIRVDFVSPRSNPAVKIGMTFCPGKVQRYAQSGSWCRSLNADILRLKEEFNIARLVCCLERHEHETLEIEPLEGYCEIHGIKLFYVPIPDGGVPSENSLKALKASLSDVLASTDLLGLTAVFCKGGLGRTGLVTACLLQELQVAPSESIQLVRSARAGTIETIAQEQFVLSYSNQATTQSIARS